MPTRRGYFALQALFFMLHFALGACMHLPIGMPDELNYWIGSRTIAQSYLPGVQPMLDGSYAGQPNLLFLALLSPAHALHSYVAVHHGMAAINSLVICVGAHAAYRLLQFVTASTSGAAWVPIAGFLLAQLSPYTNSSGLLMSECFNITAFLLFAYLATRRLAATRPAARADFRFGVFCAALFFIKPTLLVAPAIYAVAQLVRCAYIERNPAKAARPLAFFFSGYGALMLPAQFLTPVPAIGRYSHDVSIYNLDNLGKTLVCWWGEYVTLGAYTLFLSIVALVAAARLVLRSRSMPASTRRPLVAFSVLIWVAMIPTPFTLAVHAISHLAWAYPHESWYTFHERIYSYLQVLLGLLTLAMLPDVLELLRSKVTLASVGALAALYLASPKGRMEPGTEMVSSLFYSFAGWAWEAPIVQLACALALFLLFAWSLRHVSVKSRPIAATLAICALSLAIKTANYRRWIKAGVPPRASYLPTHLGPRDELDIFEDALPMTKFLVFVDNRVKVRVLKREEPFLPGPTPEGGKRYLAVHLADYDRRDHDPRIPRQAVAVDRCNETDGVVLTVD